MADVRPNYHIEQQRLISQKAQLAFQIEQKFLELMEMIDRRAKCQEAIKSMQGAMGELTTKLKALERDHGAPELPTLEVDD